MVLYSNDFPRKMYGESNWNEVQEVMLCLTGIRKWVGGSSLHLHLSLVHMVYFLWSSAYLLCSFFWRKPCPLLFYNFSLQVALIGLGANSGSRIHHHHTDSLFQCLTPKILGRRYNRPSLGQVSTYGSTRYSLWAKGSPIDIELVRPTYYSLGLDPRQCQR